MRKAVLLPVVSFFSFCSAFGQNAVFHFSLANGTSAICYLYIPAQPKKSFADLTLKDGGKASHTVNLTRPGFVQLTCFDPADWEHKHFNYLLYLSPGDDLQLSADFNQPGFALKVSGKGSTNNQPLLSVMETADLYSFNKDTLPYQVINAANAAQRLRQDKLAQYIALYKPSVLYINDWKISLQYYAADLYYQFKENNKFSIEDAYKRNFAQWQKITDSLFSAAKLDNDAALTGYHYTQLVITFLEREKEHFSDEAWFHPEAFYREWYHTDTVEGKKQFSADRKNLVQEKIIDKYFTGKTAEYLFAVLFAGAANDSNPTNIPGIFARFKEKYPNSEYVKQFSGMVDTIIAKDKYTLNDRMVFIAGNGATLNSLDEVLATMKGKTVLVDMWGTWCGPCREEIEKNSAALREHFKNKGLTYLYIANQDMDNKAQWKKLIAYFNMEGTHLLANNKLTDDIMAKIKGTGYPTIFIIKKDGSYELSKTAYPIQKDILIKQLEEDLGE